ncbi:MAG: hypothetical protein ACE5GJ_09080 [Gemmatimonadota bacterium]
MVTDATLDREGGVIVVDAGSPGVYRYDSAGVFLGALGRAGQGPGEYRQPVGAEVLADGRVVVWDPGNGRVVLYGGGPSARSFRVSNVALMAGRSLYVVGDSLVLIRARLPGAGASSSLGFLVYDLEGRPRDPIRLPWPPAKGGEAGLGGAVVPLTPTDTWIVTHEGDIVASHRSEYEIIRMNLRGDTLAVFRLEVKPPRVFPGEADAYRRAVEFVMRRRDPGWKWPRSLELPEVKPVIDDLVPIVRGGYAVVLHGPGVELPESDTPGRVNWGEERVVDVYGGRGDLVGSFSLPAGLRLIRILRDRIVATERDRLDRITVKVFRFVRPS